MRSVTSPSHLRLSRGYSPTSTSPSRFPQDKGRSSFPFAFLLLFAPILLASIRSLAIRASASSSGDYWIPQSAIAVHRAPDLHAEGLNVHPQAANKTDVLRDTRESHIPRSPIFVPEDLNNPTKVPVPPDGFPPQSLPKSHPRAELLTSIRARCKLSPRWPKHPGMHAVELRSFGPAYSSIIISEKLKVIYVPVFKVGTTSMMWHIAYLEQNSFVLEQDLSSPGMRDFFLHDMSNPGWRNHSIFRRSSEEIRSKFEDPSYLKYGFVRNPFHRVISAYMDKVVNQKIDSREYQNQMYSLYGEDLASRALRNHTKPTFKEFLMNIERVLKQPRTSNSNLAERGSFETNKSRRDLHWRPQVELLHPDLVHFDFVGRFENLREDLKVVLDWMYLHTDRRIPKAHDGKMHATNPKDKVELYRSLTTDAELRDLIVRIYRQDFKRFQFSTNVPEWNNPCDELVVPKDRSCA